MFTDGDKKKGRFFKKNSHLLNKVKIEEYNFTSISKKYVAILDNNNGNILHAALHEKQDIDKAILPLSSFEDSFEKESKRSVILPKDFTHEWEEQKKRSKRKDEESEEDEFGNEESTYEDHHDNTPAPKSEKLKPIKTAVAPPVVAPEPIKSKTVETQNVAPDHTTESRLRDLQAPQHTFKNPLEIINQKPTVEPEVPSAKQDEKIELKMKEEQIQNHSQELFDKAKASGFQEGLSQGKNEVKDLLTTLDKSMQDLAGLKSKILESTQDNFYEIIKALSIAIFGKECESNPEALFSLIKKVASRQDKDEFMVKLNPIDFAKIKDLDLGELANKISADETIEPLNFKIETQLGSVRADLKDMISQLLDDSNLSLFQKK
jgi:flagellar biosynthesis/type III secretory pathway protein FliH